MRGGWRGKRTHLIPFDQMNLLRRVSTRTSGVPICFSANFLISLMARGARFLKPLKPTHRQLPNNYNQHHTTARATYIPWIRLWMLIVYSRVTTLFSADFDFFSPFCCGCLVLGILLLWVESCC